MKAWSNGLSKFIDRLDEFTILLLFPLAILVFIRKFIKEKEAFFQWYVVLFFSIIIFIIAGLISGAINGNPIIVTVHGVFDYVKYFFVIFIYAAFFRDALEFKKMFRLLLIMTVFLGGVALIQELWALGFRYLLQNDINNEGIFILRYMPTEIRGEDYWRLAIYRAISLMSHSNVFGLYSLLILIIYLSTVNGTKWSVLIFLLTGIVFSGSRIVYSCFIIAGGAIFIKKRYWYLYVSAILIVILMLSIVFEQNNDNRGSMSYREYSRNMSVKIWKDHPVWGVGPGFFGGALSLKYYSPIYREYNFLEENLNYVQGIDQFWPQLLVETGIIGTVIFFGLVMQLFLIFYISCQCGDYDQRKGAFKGLAVFTIVIPIYSLGIILNITPVLFTYFALAGICLGSEGMNDCK
jgi:hypothetical protein